MVQRVMRPGLHQHQPPLPGHARDLHKSFAEHQFGGEALCNELLALRFS
eukprot:CAMPEP_0172683984 /NCGR_PEP_ID=MMETSP1074-20121228/19237_1 /TAXON_ID=2916 /ORGANISM="Ceratium fusus, Strain PA161109" /LENGTH=48 /DNA_ID= /DNA_START= /DNA_END= /DNA_ORIENTATION=